MSTAKLGTNLDLWDIGLKGRNVEYKPKRFAAAIMRIRDPKTTALIFRSGKMVCTGAKSEDDSKKAAKSYAKQLKKIGNPKPGLAMVIFRTTYNTNSGQSWTEFLTRFVKSGFQDFCWRACVKGAMASHGPL